MGNPEAKEKKEIESNLDSISEFPDVRGILDEARHGYADCITVYRQINDDFRFINFRFS